jgi:tetratricopeptide (TPR) repeat protein
VQLALTKIFLYQNQPQKALPFISAALALTPEQLEVILLKAQTLAANQQWLTAQNFIEGQLEKFPEAGVLRQFYTELLIQQGEFSAARQQLKQLKAAYLPAPQLLQLAHLSMQVHWYPEAEAFLKQAEKLPDFKSTALYFLAHLAIIQEKTELAIERYQQVTEGPFHIIAYTQASLLMAQQQQVDAALALLQAMRPSNAAEQTQIILTQAEILLSIQAYPQAYSLLSQQLMRDPTHIQLRYTRALIANERQHFKLAIEDLTQILAIEPNHIDALNTLGFILADQTQRYTEATDYLQHALSLEPNNPMILDSVGWLEYKKGNYPMAIKVLNKALSLKPDPEIAAHLGEVLWNAQQQQAAKKVWRDAFNAEPENLMLYETMQRHLKPNALPRMKQPQH